MTPRQEAKLLAEAAEIETLAYRILHRTGINVDLLMEDTNVDADSDLFKVAVSLEAIAVRLRLVTRGLQSRTRKLICGEGE